MGLMFGLRRSVVLEDIRTKRTLFLVEGESQEKIRVRTINTEEILLEVSGESVVLDVKGQM
ncbi:MAG: hypothetical protein HQL21_07360 [Candidatus Omnitrophica bacterium]|nr:hypothetical protein [Candidatus Omnitrophota bacterium]